MISRAGIHKVILPRRGFSTLLDFELSFESKQESLNENLLNSIIQEGKEGDFMIENAPR